MPQGSHPDADRIDKDGLPVVGTVLYPNQSFYNTQDDDTGAAHAWSLISIQHGRPQTLIMYPGACCSPRDKPCRLCQSLQSPHAQQPFTVSEFASAAPGSTVP